MFVVIEGGDGSGKSTQAALLADRMRERGHEVVLTFEPGATALGAAIRRSVLHGTDDVDPRAEALLMAADRAQHLAEVVRPALERGAYVVSDRHVPSSLVYQGIGRGLGVEAVEALNRLATAGIEPDLVVVIDVTGRIAAARASGVPDRMESAGDAFHTTVRRAYRDLADSHGWAVIDGGAAIDVVAERVWKLVEPMLP